MCEWLAEIDAVSGELDILRLAEANSECGLRVKGILQKITFEASGSNYACQKLRKVSHESHRQKLSFDSPEKILKSFEGLDCLPLAAARWLGDEKGEWGTWLAYIVLEGIDKHVPK
jgi:hypothetical protein